MIECIAVQAQPGSHTLQVVLAESASVFSSLALEQQVMIFPECILVSGALACLRCPEGFVAQEGKVPITNANLTLIDILLFDLTTRVSGKFAAVWSLKVAELNDGDLGVWIPQEVFRFLLQKAH